MKKNIILVLVLFFSLDVFTQIPNLLWDFPVQDMSFGNSAIADIDLDGKPEIVFSCYRNDSSLYALNAEDGTLLWKVNTGGCNDVAPLIMDADGDHWPDVILASSCVPKTFCYNGADGQLKWQVQTHGSDSPPSYADVDHDGKPEILHGEFNGYVICINAEDGSVQWEILVDPDSWIQTAPALLDVDQDNDIDFVVGSWNFNGDDRIYAFTGDSAQEIWNSTFPGDHIYHGAAFADIDDDMKPELVVGSYDGYVYAFNAEDGSLKWSYLKNDAYPQYVGAPVSLADINNDNQYEVVYVCGNKVCALSSTGDLLWDYTIDNYGTAFRGVSISYLNSDDTLDVVFGTSNGELIVLSGGSGTELFYRNMQMLYTEPFEIDHGVIVDDFNGDNENDLFFVGGHAEYPAIENNYGVAYAFKSIGGSGSAWPMFRHDRFRSGSVDLNSVIHVPVPAINDAAQFSYINGVIHVKIASSENGMKPQLVIYASQGKELFRSALTSGLNEVLFKSYPAGIYFYRIEGKKSKRISGAFFIP